MTHERLKDFTLVELITEYETVFKGFDWLVRSADLTEPGLYFVHLYGEPLIRKDHNSIPPMSVVYGWAYSAKEWSTSPEEAFRLALVRMYDLVLK